jgi:hypothetical protein
MFAQTYNQLRMMPCRTASLPRHQSSSPPTKPRNTPVTTGRTVV